jgi:hypothetical protein
MSNNPLYNLTDQKISFTFQNILQTDGFGNYYNGLGDEIFIARGATGATGPNNIYTTDSIPTSSQQSNFSYQYYGVTYTGGVCNITLPNGSSPTDDGKFIIVADEVGGISSYGRGINVGGSGGQLIDGETEILMKINRMSLTFLFRNNSWKII